MTISRLGLEGLVMFKGDTKFDPESYLITVPSPSGDSEIQLAVFDQVKVRIGVEKDKNTQRGKVQMTLVGGPI